MNDPSAQVQAELVSYRFIPEQREYVLENAVILFDNNKEHKSKSLRVAFFPEADENRAAAEGEIVATEVKSMNRKEKHEVVGTSARMLSGGQYYRMKRIVLRAELRRHIPVRLQLSTCETN